MADIIQVKVDEDLKDIVDGYLNNINDQVHVLAEKVAEKAFDDIAAIAHQLKGSGASYGIDLITQWAIKIEIAAQEHQAESASTYIQNLAENLKNIEILFVPEDEL